jgi:hypothetical protein
MSDIRDTYRQAGAGVRWELNHEGVRLVVRFVEAAERIASALDRAAAALERLAARA